AQLGVPGPRLHVAADELALLDEFRRRRPRQLSFALQLEKAIESDPAEDARVRVVSPPGPRLPNPFVGALPVAANVLPEGAEHPLGIAVEFLFAAHELRRGVDHFTVDVELKLVDRPVAHPNRS